MAKSKNQKLKILYLAKLLFEQTDDLHGITMPEILAYLENHDIAANRKTIYQDLSELRDFGMDILSEKRGGSVYYYLASRLFELPELKLLVDSVDSSRFITEKKSKELIRRLESLTSVHEGRFLNRQVLLTPRIKNMNESIFYSVDLLTGAIDQNRQVSFQYFQWDVQKNQVLRHDGAFYTVSPWKLLWDNSFYYLIAYDSQHESLRHYRIDKMLHLSITDLPREGESLIQKTDLNAYTERLFGMFGGKTETVTLEAENSLAGVFIDRFGKDITLTPKDQQHFIIRIEVCVSDPFFSWIMSLENHVRITGPDWVIDEMKKKIKKIRKLYKKS